MQIKDLFVKPINRPINGVIKADQDDSESVWQELEEYVVTKELDVHFRRFFAAYLATLDRLGDPTLGGAVGVWISGFFGSGKSHFLKILYYLLGNRNVSRHGQTQPALAFFDGKIQDAMLAADIKRAVAGDVDVILFNIDSKADNASGRDTILRVFLKVFNEKLGYSGDHPHIADLERRLDVMGRLDAFKAAFRASAGADWEQERDGYGFYADEMTSALAAALGQSPAGVGTWLDKAEEDFKSLLTVENFARRVRDYLDRRGPRHRLIFLVDEIGQFIGQDTHLMLNLQTITENLGTLCGGRAWVVVTSQEDIDAVLGEVRASRANDFSKIQGRFKTRLSLSSANVDEVIQKRLLSKTEAASQALETLYHAKADILKNQLSFRDVGMTFKPYAGAPNFAAVYPFAPYQFQLVQKIFEAIRRHGVTGLHLARGERSMLDAFQSAAVQLQGEAVGVLVPLYRFYPAIESFLEGIVKSTIDQAAGNPKLEPIDVLVLKTLFLIRYVDEIKGTLDNLVTLFIDRIDADRLAQRRALEASLQRLERETLIGRNGDDFAFLTNEERDISQEIKQVDLSAAEETKFLGELIFEDVLKGLRKHRFSDNGKDFGLTRLCDLHPHGTRAEGDLVLLVITPLADDYGHYREGRCVLQSSSDGGQLILRLADDQSLQREVRAYLQTEKYVLRKNDGTAGHTTLKILHERQHENRERRQRLVHQLETLCHEATYYAAGQPIQPKGATTASATADALDYLVRNSFTKLGYLQRLSANPQAEIKAVLQASDVDDLGFSLEAGEGNPQALAEVLNHAELMASVSKKMILDDLVQRFGRRPFGWPDWEIILLLARLLCKGVIGLALDGASLPPDRVADHLLAPSKWRTLTLHKRATTPPGTLHAARKLAKDVFGQMAPDGEDPLDRHLRERLGAWQSRLAQFKTLADTGDYPGATELADALGVMARLQAEQESLGLILRFLEIQADLIDLSDDVHELENFYDNQRPTWDRLRKAQARFQPNRDWLSQDSAAAAALRRIQDILAAPRPYGLIQEAASLIQTLDTRNAALVTQQRREALAAIETEIAKVQAELAGAQADYDLRNQCLHPLQALKRQVEASESIAYLSHAERMAMDRADEAFERIEQAAAKPSVTPPDKEGKVADKPVTVPIKKRRVVKARDLAIKELLESQADVEDYLGRLRQALEAGIRAGERIEIR
jgi:hypothetical protein